jgi:hypothetical protein
MTTEKSYNVVIPLHTVNLTSALRVEFSNMQQGGRWQAWYRLKTVVKLSDRVELHPATDRWMRGDRFGVVVAVGRKWIKVRMDRSNDLIPVLPGNLTVIGA